MDTDSNKPGETDSKNAKKRVMFVALRLGIGGSERVASTIMSHLDCSKFEMCLVLFADERIFDIPKDMPVFCLNKKGMWDFLRMVPDLARLIRAWKPDVVLSSWIYTNIVVVLSRGLFKPGYKLILLDHDLPSAFVPSQRRRVPRLVYKWFPRFLYPLADKIICVSQGAAADFRGFYKIRAERVNIIYNPVDLDQIGIMSQQKADFPWPEDDHLPVVVYTGRLVAAKGLAFLLKAFAELIHTVPCRLAIIGPGEEERDIEALAHEMQLDAQVAFLGLQTNPFKFMARSSVFVCPSTYESFGMVIIEAMACGIPVISTDCIGPREIIRDGENGLLVPYDDVAALVSAMRKVLTDKDLAADLAARGRMRAKDFDVKEVIKQYEKLLLD